MKKIIAQVLILVLLTSIFVSCGAKENSGASTASTEEQSNVSEDVSSDNSEQQSIDSTSKSTFKEDDLAPKNEQDKEVLETYVYPYAVTNLFGKQFSSEDKSQLDGDFLMTIFTALHMKNGEGFPTIEGPADEPIKVTADVIENGILSNHFELSADEIKEKCIDYYNDQDNTYNTQDGLGGGPTVFKIIDNKIEGELLTFSYEWYSPADGSGIEFELYRKGTMSIKQTDEGFIFISNESTEV